MIVDSQRKSFLLTGFSWNSPTHIAESDKSLLSGFDGNKLNTLERKARLSSHLVSSQSRKINYNNYSCTNRLRWANWSILHGEHQMWRYCPITLIVEIRKFQRHKIVSWPSKRSSRIFAAILARKDHLFIHHNTATFYQVWSQLLLRIFPPESPK